jgi:hypothetical protein
LAEEFTIKSEAIETKINQLLPTQGGFQPGVDFSASTMVIPIVDLTETAEGSGLRQDLQSAFSHGSANAFDFSNATNVIVNTAGYYRIIAGYVIRTASGSSQNITVSLSDGFSSKTIFGYVTQSGAANEYIMNDIDLMVFLNSGDSLSIGCSSQAHIRGSTRQIADLSGNLTNPT